MNWKKTNVSSLPCHVLSKNFSRIVNLWSLCLTSFNVSLTNKGNVFFVTVKFHELRIVPNGKDSVILLKIMIYFNSHQIIKSFFAPILLSHQSTFISHRRPIPKPNKCFKNFYFFIFFLFINESMEISKGGVTIIKRGKCFIQLTLDLVLNGDFVALKIRDM